MREEKSKLVSVLRFEIKRAYKNVCFRHPVTEQLMLETYICSVIRAFLFADDDDYNITAYRRFNPIPNREAEEKFLEAASKMFSRGMMLLIRFIMAFTNLPYFSGWQFGSELEVQVPTLISNNLTAAFFKYLDLTKSYDAGVNLLEKLREKDFDFSALLARCYLEMGEFFWLMAFFGAYDINEML